MEGKIKICESEKDCHRIERVIEKGYGNATRLKKIEEGKCKKRKKW